MSQSNGINVNFSFSFTVPESCIRALYGTSEDKRNKREKEEKKRDRKKKEKIIYEVDDSSDPDCEGEEIRYVEIDRRKVPNEAGIIDVDEQIIDRIVDDLCDEYGVDNDEDKAKLSTFIHDRYDVNVKTKISTCLDGSFPIAKCNICSSCLKDLIRHGTYKEIKDSLTSKLDKSQAVVINDSGKKKFMIAYLHAITKLATGSSTDVKYNEDGSERIEEEKFKSTVGLAIDSFTEMATERAKQANVEPMVNISKAFGPFLKGMMENVIDTFGSQSKEKDNIVDVDKQLIDRIVNDLCDEYGVDNDEDKAKLSTFIHCRYNVDSGKDYIPCLSGPHLAAKCNFCSSCLKDLVKRGTYKEIKDSLIAKLDESQVVVINDSGKKKFVIAYMDFITKLTVKPLTSITHNEDGSQRTELEQFKNICGLGIDAIVGTEATQHGNDDFMSKAFGPLLKGVAENLADVFESQMPKKSL